MQSQQGRCAYHLVYVFVGILLSQPGMAAGFSPTVMQAAPLSFDYYARANLGFIAPQDMHGKSTRYHFKSDGFMFSGAFGLRFPHWMTELQYNYMTTTVREVTAGGVSEIIPAASAANDVDTYSVLLNGYCYYPGILQWLTAYAGVGIGYANVDLSLPSTVSQFGSGGALAMQTSLGMSVALGTVLDVNLGYRYFLTSKVSGFANFQAHVLDLGVLFHLDRF